MKPKKLLQSLKEFPLDPIFFKWDREENDNIFRTAIADLGMKGDKINIERLVDILGIAADISYSEVKNNFTRTFIIFITFIIAIIIIFGIIQI